MSLNKKDIRLGKSRYLVIDLTEPLKEGLEVYPGDPKPQKQVFSNIQETGYQHHIYKISDHSFHPHGDAPKHQNLDLQDKGFDSFGLDYCFNSACLIDLSIVPQAEDFNGIKYLVKVNEEHLKPFRELFSKKQAILIRTGYDRWLEENRPHQPANLPYLTKQAAELIASFNNIKVIGIDSLTVDLVGSHDSHRVLKNMLIVESLVHLYEIPEKARDNFDLQTSPVRINGATGGPIIAYAFISL